MTRRLRDALAVGCLLAPPALKLWMTFDEATRYDMVAHAAAWETPEERERRLLAPSGSWQRVDEIPDRFVELLLEQPEPPGLAGSERIRRWFPRTFLWAPRVITDADGHAEVPFKAPDTLTEWRVVGMGLTTEGHVGGNVLRFSTGQAVSLDLSLPGRLRAGDRLSVPVQATNTSAEVVQGTLRVQAGALGNLSEEVSLAPGETYTTSLRLQAATPGEFDIRADFGDADALATSLEVVPIGWQERQGQGGPILSRTPLAVPAGGGDRRLRLRVFPVASALEAVREDLATPQTWGEAAAAWALACRLDDDRLRREAAIRLSHPTEEEVSPLQRSMAERLCPEHEMPRSLAEVNWRYEEPQRPDGSWPVPPGAPLSQLLSLAALNSVLSEDELVLLRSRALFERHAGRVADPFSAALLLYTGLLDAHSAELLRQRVREGLASGEVSGVRPDGLAATEVDVLAAAALAMPPDEAALARAALAVRPGAEGWGDGFSHLLAITALAEAPLPRSSGGTLRLLAGTELLSSLPITPDVPQEITVPLPKGERFFWLEGDSTMEGMVWQAVLETWRSDDTVAPALDASLEEPEALRLGERGEVRLHLAAPPEAAVEITHHLPAGLRLVTGSLEGEGARVSSGGAIGEVRIWLAAGHEPEATLTYAVQAIHPGEVSGGGVHIRAAGQEIWRGVGRQWVVVP